MRSTGSVFWREITQAWAGGSGAFLPVGFFLGATMLAPLSIGSDQALLTRLGPGLIWVMLTLAALITLERMFQSDLEDGALDLLLLSEVPAELTSLMKVMAHWLVTGGPLLLLYPILAIMLGVPFEGIAGGAISLLIGSLGLFLWGGVASALTAGVRRGGPLIALLVFPLYGPIVIFGAGAGNAAAESGVLIGPATLFLAASTLAALAIAPFAMAAAMRVAVD